MKEFTFSDLQVLFNQQEHLEHHEAVAAQALLRQAGCGRGHDACAQDVAEFSGKVTQEMLAYDGLFLMIFGEADGNSPHHR